ncbi:sugar transferase [Nafulsella turpanensis]|uniref:sugar transferase n=1 Tax=Nafulsella turpanensis TaxID=1265690 RepID=UPI00034494C1|nr:sugar transferase [Nafulsella turpanensis]
MPTEFFNKDTKVRQPKLSVELEKRIRIKEQPSGSKTKKSPLSFLNQYLDIGDKKKTVILNTQEIQDVKHLYNVADESGYYQNVVNLRRINDIRWINKFFETVNEHLPKGGRFVGCVETKAMRKQRLLKKYPAGLNWAYYTGDFIFKRIFPKVPVLKQLYFNITKGRNRVITSVEALGRLYSCGFKVVGLQQRSNLLYFIAEKVKEPDFNLKPSYGPLFQMRRFGKDGKFIYVYKLRTMHPYAEYLQEYIYEQNKLCEGGKFKDDFRVTTLGKFCRKFWLDEVPMILNVLKGDLKLVGVRPLSSHYLSLYTPELQEKRKKVKPGLLPPFYADMPKTLEEIMESEMRYLEAYEKNPLKADFAYLMKICHNIVIKKARSK